jgi:hypothetical protein
MGAPSVHRGMDEAMDNDMPATGAAPTAWPSAPLAETDASQLQARCIAAAMSSHQEDDCAACRAAARSVARLASPIKKTELFRSSRKEHRSRGPANILSALEDLSVSDWLSGSLAGHEHDHQDEFVAGSLNGGQALERREDFHSHADHVIATC